MPHVVPPTTPSTFQTNLTVASRTGTTVTASATIHTKGAYTSLVDPTSIESYGIWIRASGVAASATVTRMLMDMSYGPTGGGSEEVLVPNINVGATAGLDLGPTKMFFFPTYIPTGVRVSARSQAQIASDTVLVSVHLGQKALYPWHCGRITDYGTNLSVSGGTSVAPGSGAFGAWVELLNPSAGSGLVRPHRYWTMAHDQLADTTLAGAHLLAELGVGPDLNNVTTIFTTTLWQSGAEEMGGVFPPIGYAPVTVDATNLKLWTRLASAEVEARGVIAYGMD